MLPHSLAISIAAIKPSDRSISQKVHKVSAHHRMTASMHKGSNWLTFVQFDLRTPTDWSWPTLCTLHNDTDIEDEDKDADDDGGGDDDDVGKCGKESLQCSGNYYSTLFLVWRLESSLLRSCASDSDAYKASRMCRQKRVEGLWMNAGKKRKSTGWTQKKKKKPLRMSSKK